MGHTPEERKREEASSRAWALWYTAVLLCLLTLLFFVLALVLPRGNECSVNADCSSIAPYGCVNGVCNCSAPGTWHPWQCDQYNYFWAGTSAWIWVTIAFAFASIFVCSWSQPDRVDMLLDLKRRVGELERRAEALKGPPKAPKPG